MKRDLTRRSFLTRALLLPWLPVLGQRARADGEGLAGLEFGPAQPFSFDGLRQQAQRLAAQPYQTPPSVIPISWIVSITMSIWKFGIGQKLRSGAGVMDLTRCVSSISGDCSPCR